MYRIRWIRPLFEPSTTSRDVAEILLSYYRILHRVCLGPAINRRFQGAYINVVLLASTVRRSSAAPGGLGADSSCSREDVDYLLSEAGKTSAEWLAGLSFKELCGPCHTMPFVHAGQLRGDWTYSVPARVSPEDLPNQWQRLPVPAILCRQITTLRECRNRHDSPTTITERRQCHTPADHCLFHRNKYIRYWCRPKMLNAFVRTSRSGPLASVRLRVPEPTAPRSRAEGGC